MSLVWVKTLYKDPLTIHNAESPGPSFGSGLFVLPVGSARGSAPVGHLPDRALGTICRPLLSAVFLLSRPCPNPCSQGHFSCLDSPFSFSYPLKAQKGQLFRLRFKGFSCVLLTILIKTGASSFNVPFLIKFVRYLINFFRRFGGWYISSSARVENRPAHYPATTHPKVPLFTTLSQRMMFHF